METSQKQKVDIQGIFTNGAAAYLEKYPANTQQRKAIYSIVHCRSAHLGRHIDKCDRCGHLEVSYNSCRNRHCPQCQANKQYQWVEQLKGSLLPVRYFHLVFTLPHSLNELVYKYQEDCYTLLFRASAKALFQVASRPGFLGAQTGCLSVLHTWGQNLQYHPHIHMLVPAGGVSEDQMEWIPSRKKFFVPVKVLSKVFRGKFIALVEEWINQGNIPVDLPELKASLYKTDWVVYSKKCFAGPVQVLTYLGRYTHRVAISNSRIIDHQQGKVSFKWKDYKRGKQWKTMKLDTLEFIRRYLFHVLPMNFYKIRYYGLFALANREQVLRHCFSLIASMNDPFMHHCGKPILKTIPVLQRVCPACRIGRLRFLTLLSPFRLSGAT